MAGLFLKGWVGNLIWYIWFGRFGLVGLVWKFGFVGLYVFDWVKTVRNSIRLVKLARLNQSGYVS